MPPATGPSDGTALAARLPAWRAAAALAAVPTTGGTAAAPAAVPTVGAAGDAPAAGPHFRAAAAPPLLPAASCLPGRLLLLLPGGLLLNVLLNTAAMPAAAAHQLARGAHCWVNIRQISRSRRYSWHLSDCSNRCGCCSCGCFTRHIHACGRQAALKGQKLPLLLPMLRSCTWRCHGWCHCGSSCCRCRGRRHREAEAGRQRGMCCRWGCPF